MYEHDVDATLKGYRTVVLIYSNRLKSSIFGAFDRFKVQAMSCRITHKLDHHVHELGADPVG